MKTTMNGTTVEVIEVKQTKDIMSAYFTMTKPGYPTSLYEATRYKRGSIEVYFMRLDAPPHFLGLGDQVSERLEDAAEFALASRFVK